jgi:hypothetical protein
MAKAFRPDELSGQLPPTQARAKSERKALITSDARGLLEQTFEPIRWAVPGLIPEGVTLFAGAPKVGKSWAALDISIAIASGGHVFGDIQVDPGESLYLALEDNPRRMQRRLTKALRGGRCPDGLHFAYAAPAIDEGLIAELSAFLDAHPSCRIVTVDTIKPIRPVSGKNDRIYDTDYAVGRPFLDLAAKYHIAVVLVHHTNKSKSEDDLDTISGSQGLAGGVDNILVLKRGRASSEATLYVTGRDIEQEGRYSLVWNQDISMWTVGADCPAASMSPERRAVYDTISNVGPINGRDLTALMNPGVAINRDSKEWAKVRYLLTKLRAEGAVEMTADGMFSVVSAQSALHGYTRYTPHDY